MADSVASGASMQKSLVKTDDFAFTSYQRIGAAGKDLNIYIEGDGFAFATRNRISSNPTPNETTLLELAASDKSPNVVYLARPCQYTEFALNNKECNRKFWSGSRFSEEVVHSMDQAVDEVVKKSGGGKVNFIGYSGGGAIAVLLTARRGDVASLRTIAGNLDSEAINSYHKVGKMPNSLNPADFVSKIANVPQYHFSGADDKVVPVFIAQDLVNKIARISRCAHVKIINKTTHSAGWRENWDALLALPVACDGKTS